MKKVVLPGAAHVPVALCTQTQANASLQSPARQSEGLGGPCRPLTHLPQLFSHFFEFPQDAFELPDDHLHALSNPFSLSTTVGVVTGLPEVRGTPNVHPSPRGRKPAHARPTGAHASSASTEPPSAGQSSTS